MRKNAFSDSEDPETYSELAVSASPATIGLPNRLMTVFEVAKFVGCH
jgi:hypothetical protein